MPDSKRSTRAPAFIQAPGRVRGAAWWRRLPLLLALMTVAGLVATPAQAFLSRRLEARADAHALALTGDPSTFEAMQRRLSAVNLADPDPPRWEHLYSATHPSTVERMAAARPSCPLMKNHRIIRSATTSVPLVSALPITNTMSNTFKALITM